MIALNQRYSYEEICESMEVLAHEFSEFTVCRSIGTSHDGRRIPMLRVGLGLETLICTAGIHGRESINPVLLLRMIEIYCTYCRSHELLDGVDVFSLLKQYSICFIPLVNPDGYEIALYGFDSIRNPVLRKMCLRRKCEAADWKYNARGVDINRNFPCKSYVQQQLLEFPASEQETRALMRVMQDYETVGYLDFHSRGNVIYYYRGAMPFTYNNRCRNLAKKLQRSSGYHLGKKEDETPSPTSGGNSVHFYSETIRKPAITIETVAENASFPLLTIYQENVWQETRLLPLVLLQEL